MFRAIRFSFFIGLLFSSSVFAGWDPREAREGLPIRGVLQVIETMKPEKGYMGWVGYYVKEEGSGRLFSFRHEDGMCVLLPEAVRCGYQAERKNLPAIGARVEMTQKHSWWTDRLTVRVRVLR